MVIRRDRALVAKWFGLIKMHHNTIMLETPERCHCATQHFGEFLAEPQATRLASDPIAVYRLRISYTLSSCL